MEKIAKKTVSVPNAGQQLGIGRQLAYELARKGELPGVVRLGTRYVVSQAVLDRVLTEGVATPGPATASN